MATDRLRVGLIGAGKISGLHMRAWRELGADVTVYSLEGAEQLAAEFGASVAGDVSSLLKAAELVDIVTPSGTHEELALQAIGAGRHVICEKPLAHTSAGARRIVTAAAVAGVSVFPAHVARYFPEYSRVKAAIEAGQIGAPAVLRLTRAAAAPSPGSWFFDESRGGGLILDLMIHDLDLARWLAGDVVSVRAAQSPMSVDAVTPGVVAAQVVLTHGRGAVSVIHGVWGPPVTPFRTSVDVAGSLGTLHHDSRENPSLLSDLPVRPGGGSYLPPDAGGSPYTQELRDFAVAVRGGTDPRVSALDGVAAVRIAEAAYQSIRTGDVVEVSEHHPAGAETGAVR